MIKTTIKEALTRRTKTDGHYIYVYRDNGVVFYVGQSKKPMYRFAQHMGKYRNACADLVGSFILDNMPESQDWQIEIYTLEECKPFLTHDIRFYEESINSPLPFIFDMVIDQAEVALIRHFNPCLNTLDNPNPSRIPEKYTKNNKIANEGVKLG